MEVMSDIRRNIEEGDMNNLNGVEGISIWVNTEVISFEQIDLFTKLKLQKQMKISSLWKPRPIQNSSY